jgi:hypothetical protein
MIKRGASLLLASGLMLTTVAFAQTPKKAKTSSDQTQTRMSEDMRRAIEFQQAKDRADARQARLEARHPSVPAPSAERSAEDSTVKDAGPPPVRKGQ